MPEPALSEDREAEVRAHIRDLTKPSELARDLPRVGAEAGSAQERIPLPIRLPKMYYEALKEWSNMTGQSMNFLAVEAIGKYLREI